MTGCKISAVLCCTALERSEQLTARCRCYCTISKLACSYVGGPMLWTRGCEKADCGCMDETGKGRFSSSMLRCFSCCCDETDTAINLAAAGEACPQPPAFSDDDRAHPDHVGHRPQVLWGDDRRPEHRHPPSHWGGHDIYDRHNNEL